MDEYLLLQPRQIRSFSFRKRWMTSILTSLDGVEQRFALLTWPKRTLVFSPLGLNAIQLNYLKRVLFKNLYSSWGIPFWQDETTLTAQAASGQNILNVGSTQYRNFEVGASCLLFKLVDYLPVYEVGVVNVLTNTQITLVDNLTSTWDVGTKVFPLLKSKLSAEQLIEMLEWAIGDVAIEASEDFDNTITRHTPSIVPFSTYLSYLVFPFRPKQNTLRIGLHHPYEHLVFLGESCSDSFWLETAHRVKAEFTSISRTEIQQYLDFFDYHKGRHGNFWFPTWQKDVVPNVAFLSGDTQITIDDIDYGSYWDEFESAKHLAFRWPDGTLICREVVGYGDDTLTLDSAIGKASPSDLAELTVSFLLMGRFDIDEIEVIYHLASNVSMDLSFYSLPLETVSGESS